MATTRTLYSWGPQDPASLYAASLLRCEDATRGRSAVVASSSGSGGASGSRSNAQPPLVFRTPSPVLHPVTPCVELDGVQVAAGLAAVRRSVQLADLDERAVPLHALLDTRLECLVLHALFIPPQNLRTTGPLYVRHLSALHRRSVLARLRASVRARLLREGLEVGSVGGAGEEEDEWRRKLDAGREAEERARRMRGGARIDDKARREMRDSFQRVKILSSAMEVLGILSSQLGEESYFFGASSPAPLDLHLFSLLHPLSTCDLPSSPLPSLLADYPSLLAHTQRVHTHLWGDAATPFAQHEDAHPPSWTGTLRTLTSQARLLRTDLAFLLPLRAADADADARERRSQDAATRAAQRRLRLGALVWSLSAVLGTVAYAFGSGLLSISLEAEDSGAGEEGAEGSGEVGWFEAEEMEGGAGAGASAEEEGHEDEVEEEWEVELDDDDEDVELDDE